MLSRDYHFGYVVAQQQVRDVVHQQLQVLGVARVLEDVLGVLREEYQHPRLQQQRVEAQDLLEVADREALDLPDLVVSR